MPFVSLERPYRGSPFIPPLRFTLRSLIIRCKRHSRCRNARFALCGLREPLARYREPISALPSALPSAPVVNIGGKPAGAKSLRVKG